jgi:hypothetical protein
MPNNNLPKGMETPTSPEGALEPHQHRELKKERQGVLELATEVEGEAHHGSGKAALRLLVGRVAKRG